mgnify:CR=1 FL=1
MNFPPLFARFSLLCTVLLCTLPFLQPYHLYPLTTFYSEWLAFALGLGVIVSAILLTGIYVRRANGEFDRLTATAVASARS